MQVKWVVPHQAEPNFFPRTHRHNRQKFTFKLDDYRAIPNRYWLYDLQCSHINSVRYA